MAEQTGVTPNETHSEGSSPRGGRGNFLKKNKGLVLGGGGLLAFLLLSHKGSSASQNASTNAQAQQDALAAQQAALESGAVIPPNGYGPGVTGQSGDTSGGSSSGGSTDAGGSTTDPNQALTDAVTGLIAADAANAATQGTDTDPNSSANASATAEPAATSKSGAKGKGAKTGKKTQSKKKSTAHANPHTTHSGGHGAIVHGRTFPGAKSAHVGPVQKVGVNVTNRVTVNYGGHTDTHTSINNGAAWKDHTGGPPSRQTVHSAPARPAPVRRPAPAPVHRAAPARRK